ncbi:BppU family phage baseplate upper protein, partial [Enterococcus entomosocium]
MANVYHNITLSLTDFNNVGDLKVRQADEKTHVFDVQIIEDGKIKPFTGLKPFFCLMAREITGQGVSEEPVQNYDSSAGTLKYTLSDNAFQMVGRN